MNPTDQRQKAHIILHVQANQQLINFIHQSQPHLREREKDRCGYGVRTSFYTRATIPRSTVIQRYKSQAKFR